MAKQLTMEARLRNRALRRDLKQSERLVQGFAANTKKQLKAGFGAVAGGLAGLGTISGLQSAATEAIAFEKTLTRIGIQAGGGANLDALRAQARSLGDEFGISKTDVVGALDAIVGLEGAAGATPEKMRLLAMAATATGAEISDLAGVSYALNNAFKFSNAKDAEKGFSAVIQAGKDGSIPLAEMATVLQQNATKFAAFADSGAAGAAQLAASLQIARKGFGSAGETGTGLKAFIDQLEQNEMALKAYGVAVKRTGKDGKRSFVPMTEIFDQLAKKGISNKNVFTKLFGSSEARQFIRTIEENRDALDDLTASAINSNSTQEDAQAFLQSNAGKLQRSIERVKAKFVDLMTPERLEKFANAAEKAADVVGFLADHLDLVIAAVIGFKALNGALAFSQMAKAAAGLGTSATGAAGGIGALGGGMSKLSKFAGAAGPLAMAAAAGWELGRALDEATGLSESLGSGLASLMGVNEASRTAQAQVKEKTTNVALAALTKAGVLEGGVVSEDVTASIEAKKKAFAESGRFAGMSAAVGRAAAAEATPEQLGLTAVEAAAQTALRSGLVRTETQAGGRTLARGGQAEFEAKLFTAQAPLIAQRLAGQAAEGGAPLTVGDIERQLAQGSTVANLLGAQFQRSQDAQAANTQAILNELRALNEARGKDQPPIRLEIDGKDVLSTTKNTPSRRRRPPK